MKHKFQVNGQELYINKMRVFAVLAILRLQGMESNVRVFAIKSLREGTSLGLLEAKLIVDFLEGYGSIHPNGQIIITPPRLTVSYCGEVAE